MSWLTRARRGALLYLLAWLIVGAVLGGVCAVLAPAPPVNALLFAIPGTLVYGVAAGFSAYYLCRANPLGARPVALVVLMLCTAAVVAAFMWLAVLGGWNELCLAAGVRWAGIVQTPLLSAFLFALGALLYGLLAAINYLATESGRARNAERRELESKLMAQDAELRMLRTQVDPHFLFNSLNSVSALTSHDPKGAREMTLRLAGFFRRSQGLAGQQRITLAQEMELVRDFLAIEKVRFGDRLVTEEALEKGALDCLVPPMIIQPLVENAIKHGIGQLTEGGLVLVAAWRDGTRLSITVSNAIDPEVAQGRGGGIGLANVRRRLACAYPNGSALEWKREGDTFSVQISLPAQTSETTGSDAGT
ncbi:sensor histidine kinase [Pseudoduganella umbonata]|uniref:Sensor histidine kinase n=1 Tax=Pseudoduganella umbonata TaxID=864828 RepID=A0A4P8HJN7_9BURK|nr:histidine kinase [Pseudoduganella umbonata]MBB3221756.1 sensor histidine kinase YesM [Pseudoduganella umbonata]QCP09026.1 sensor histidine kinase [Pseudoduganella umbonata]